MPYDKHVVVLGAGVAGLYAARVLAGAGIRTTVIEKAEVVGGLAAGRRRGANFYDFGVHHLHAQDQEIFVDLQGLLGSRLQPIEKRALIKYGKGFRRFPLQFMDILKGIPPWELTRSVSGLAWQTVKNKFSKHEAQDAEEALIELYGQPLYQHFFRDFTERYWGVPTRELSATFVRSKMPRLSAVDTLKKALGRVGLKEQRGKAVESATLQETLYYPPTGAREISMALADYVRENAGRVVLKSAVTAVEGDGQRVRAVRWAGQDGSEERADCDFVISTIPVPLLIAAWEPQASTDVLESSRELRFKGTAVYAYLVKKPKVLNALYVYFRERIFHRLAEPKLSGLEVEPEGTTVLLAETTCNPGDDRWLGGEATRRRMLADLEAEGLLQEDDILETHVFVNEHAYPIFSLGFEPHLARVENFLKSQVNLLSTGRNGGFCYPNMHGAMRMGAEAAQEFLNSKPK